MNPTDPIFHGFISDGLPDSHPLAFETLRCVGCDVIGGYQPDVRSRRWVLTYSPFASSDTYMTDAEADFLSHGTDHGRFPTTPTRKRRRVPWDRHTR